LSTPPEIVVLALKKVVYCHTEYPLLEEFLVRKYGFKKMEEEVQEISKFEEKIPIDRAKIVLKEEIRAPIVSEQVRKKYSSLEIFEGNYLDAKIKVYILGGVVQKKDTVEISEQERYSVYTSEYQMVKFVSESGYALQRLIERLTVDLGLKIRSKRWFFRRSEEA
jgi:hypothetical protein